MRTAKGYTLLKLGNSLNHGHRHRGVGQTVPATRIAGRPATPASQHFSTGSSHLSQGILRGILLPVIAGAGAGVGCGSAAYYYGPGSPKTPAAAALDAADEQSATKGVQLTPAWARELAGRRGVLEVLNPEALRTRSHPLLSEDHMFSALVRNEMVQSLSCYFEPEHKQFYSVIQLGTNICGYKRIVHGGLTAAMCDETFGGLLFALRKQRALPFFGPAFTAQLDMTYRGKIHSCSTILCTAEVESIEGRKVWMRAIVSDGPDGRVYATARALFVAPKPQRLIHDGIRLVVPAWPFGK